MSVVKINVLQVPEGRGEVLEQRFAARAGEVEKVEGFESFDLLRPTEGTDRYLVVTRWRDEDSFQAWMSSQAFQRGHAQSQADGEAAAGGDAAAHGGPSAHGGGHPDEHAPAHPTPGAEAAGHGGEAPPAGGHGTPGGGGPAAVGSELWGFEIVTSAHAHRPT